MYHKFLKQSLGRTGSNGYMEFKRTSRFSIRRNDKSYKRKIPCRRIGIDSESTNPITPITIDKETRHITLAYFDQKSTVDYIGAVQGIPICFDAKECAVDTFALQNIHQHQVQFMRDFEKQQGIAFFLIYYTSRDLMYYMSIRDLDVFWERMEQGGRKSFRFDELNKEFFIKPKIGQMVPYLEMIQLDLRRL